MCVECGCESVGSSTGIKSAPIINVTSQGNAGLTLDMTASRQQRESFIEEDQN